MIGSVTTANQLRTAVPVIVAAGGGSRNGGDVGEGWRERTERERGDGSTVGAYADRGLCPYAYRGYADRGLGPFADRDPVVGASYAHRGGARDYCAYHAYHAYPDATRGMDSAAPGPIVSEAPLLVSSFSLQIDRILPC